MTPKPIFIAVVALTIAFYSGCCTRPVEANHESDTGVPVGTEHGYEELCAVAPEVLARWCFDRYSAVDLLAGRLSTRFAEYNGLTNYLETVRAKNKHAYEADIKDIEGLSRSLNKSVDSIFMFRRPNGEFGFAVFRRGQFIREFWVGGQSTE